MHTQVRLHAFVESLPRVPGILQVDTSLVSTHDEARQLLVLFLKPCQPGLFCLELTIQIHGPVTYLSLIRDSLGCRIFLWLFLMPLRSLELSHVNNLGCQNNITLVIFNEN